jgi:hypothetical protein
VPDGRGNRDRLSRGSIPAGSSPRAGVLAALPPAVIDLLAGLRIMGAAIHPGQHVNLLLSQAIRPVGLLAKKFGRAKAAGLGVHQEVVARRAALLIPAFLDDRIGDERELLRRDYNAEVGAVVVLAPVERPKK